MGRLVGRCASVLSRCYICVWRVHMQEPAGPLLVGVRAGVRCVCMYMCGASYCLTNYKQRKCGGRWVDGRLRCLQCGCVCTSVCSRWTTATRGWVQMCQDGTPLLCLSPSSLPQPAWAAQCTVLQKKKKRDAPTLSPPRGARKSQTPVHREETCCLFSLTR